MTTQNISLSFVSIICSDFISQASFYGTVFSLPEIEELASEHFRALRVGGTTLGFHTPGALELLSLPPETIIGDSSASFWTFETADEAAVDTLVADALTAGATLVKAPYLTYYGARQAVLRDPEGNVFRINRSGVQ
ncbi:MULTISPECIES: VOC family protein [Mycobacteriales]|jgi:catechol 2,3-dioxygenase-like lactoylglutathione lyase family enzyme|uniref:Glyoxalase-like domain-containing protein n=1 Tax=Gordonia sputi NBRC 100414 TaxID=1089453 RepID=H5U1D6_9ACTN|nr:MULTISPECIES: VOC family protein [Mycobacteriales]MCM3898061.1 glyoxalase [Gordonia sputi]NKY95834.1 glyoxalase [Gordonia sputi]OBA35127.1 glyoxalase [Gordonia sp. 852002-51296_SCH5728562-b]UEA61117.1 glyoxalase [Gordonia otitidis]GAB39544.1 hypothetical protein GOSPT_071_00060 [Gordonia sputi NBRC 100414]